MPRARTTATSRKRRSKRQQFRFDQQLVLNQFFLEYLGFSTFEEVKTTLAGIEAGVNESGISNFYYAITSSSSFLNNAKIDADTLIQYDENIVRQTSQMQGTRSTPISWLYFQYICLLFVEIYLDKFFSDKESFVTELNNFRASKISYVDIPDYTENDLRKVALWNATGSGKTLLMHMNLLQFRYYAEKYKVANSINQTILVTPNEGLSRQHIAEFQKSKIDADIFDKDMSSGIFKGKRVEVIEVTKLKEDGKEKTVSVESFEDNNLVFIDEVHKGTGGDEFKKNRDSLSMKGFAFEYSATIGQAVKAANNDTITNEYAKSTIFDYSYKYFYNDGYGKDYRILNISDASYTTHLELYLTGCLLAYYQQIRLYKEYKDLAKKFHVEKPLWIFVGRTVTGSSKLDTNDTSDILRILKFIKAFLEDENTFCEHINTLINGKSGLIDNNGKSVFSNVFTHLPPDMLVKENVYDDILKSVFNAPSKGALHIEDLKGTSGEIALRIGDNEPFGVVNVGDSATLIKLCKEQYADDFVISDKNFSGSLFDNISDNESSLNLLVGAKKFTEGWNCYRVSTMGLMNLGRTEGSEIIQLFGRGVRLHGYNGTMKRFSGLPEGVKRPFEKNQKSVLNALETLNIFGIRADYMKKFKEYLEEEGLPTGDDRREFTIPIIRKLPTTTKLKIIRLKEGMDFKKSKKISLEYVDVFSRFPTILDWYPKIQSLLAKGVQGGNSTLIKNENKLSKSLLAFVDWEDIYLKLQEYKAEKAMYNLNLSITAIKNIFKHDDWYTLLIANEELNIAKFSSLKLISDIVLALGKKYCERFFHCQKSDWEKDKLEYVEITEKDPNFYDNYEISVKETETDFIKKLEELSSIVASKQLRDLDLGSGYAFYFDKHLYNPILSIKNNEYIEVKPVSLNEGESKFIKDLRAYFEAHKDKFQNAEFYIMRNRSKAGIGFFEEGGFYPDFILWYVKDEKQYIAFVDPKGIYHLNPKHPKLNFYRRIKEIGKNMRNLNIKLNSFIISVTPFDKINWKGNKEQSYFESKNIIFQEDSCYIEKLMRKVVPKDFKEISEDNKQLTYDILTYNLGRKTPFTLDDMFTNGATLLLLSSNKELFEKAFNTIILDQLPKYNDTSKYSIRDIYDYLDNSGYISVNGDMISINDSAFDIMKGFRKLPENVYELMDKTKALMKSIHDETKELTVDERILISELNLCRV